jgi:hypothetical protein
MSMIRKSGNRFSEKIMLKMKGSMMQSNIMRNTSLIVALLIGSVMPAFAASEADFKAAYAAAEAANKEAAGLRNQWTTTAATLAAAKKAADSGDFDQAVAQAREAEALAKASIFQATSEKERWKDLEIR